MRKRRTMTAAIALLLAVVVIARHPTADIEILTHQAGDPAPHRVQAAIDLGLVAVKLLVTWTADHISH